MSTDPMKILATMRLESGEPWGKVATPFQLEDARAILAPGPDDERLHWLGRPKGGSKTTDLGGVALAWLVSMADELDEAVVIAADQDQARRMLTFAAGLIRRTPGLAAKVEVQTWALVNKRNGARVIALAADAAGAEGLLSPLILVDELPQWGGTGNARAMWDSAFSSIPKCAALPGGVTFVVIGHAGIEGSWQHRTFERVQASPMWRVNDVPGPLPWLDPGHLEDQRHELTDSQYARRVLNRWSSAEDAIATVDELRRCVTHVGPLPAEASRDYVVAADLGVRNDRTVAVVAHLERLNEPWLDRLGRGVSSLPQARQAPTAAEYAELRQIRERLEQESLSELGGFRVVVDRMEVWQGSRRQPVSLAAVQQWLLSASRAYNRAPLVVDPWQALSMVESLRGSGVDVSEFTFSTQSVGRLASTLHRLIRDGALGLPDDEALLDELAHVRLVEKTPGVVRMDHTSGRHDDRAIALALAAVRLLERPVDDGEGPVQVRWAEVTSAR